MPQTRFLDELTLKRHYDPASDGTDLVNAFYIPCLSRSNRYDRISAYFSSAVLRSFCPGLHFLYQNEGRIRFIFSCQLEKSDMEMITQGYEKRFDAMAAELERDSALLSNDFEISNLGYLIEHNLADVKIAFMLRDEASILHIKAGLFADSKGNKIFFEGSGNETISGTMRNAENYIVSTTFSNEQQANDVEDGERLFERIWNNTYSDTVRAEFPIGKLFEKLKSLSKGQIFSSQKEFLRHQNCVYVDVDENNQRILLNDYTETQALKNPRALRTCFGECWIDLGVDAYGIDRLRLRDLRDVIIPRLDRQGIEYILTNEAQHFLENNNLELEKRFKLGLAIKQNQNVEVWERDYNHFQYIVNNEVVARLKEQQMKNAFFHYEMVSSADFSVPGTGKTYISYGLFAYLSSADTGQKCDHIVVFGPLNCFAAWKEEGKKIFGNKRSLSFFDITEHRGDYRETLQEQKYDVYLINYDWLGLDNEKLRLKLEILSNEVLSPKTLLVFDEVHKLKSLTGITASNFIRLISECRRKPIFRLVLTGTPLPNSFADVLNYLKILYPADVSSVFSTFSPARLKSADDNPIIADEVTEKLLPVFVRTTKRDLEVPLPDPDDFDTLGVTPSCDERALYQEIWKFYDNPLLKYIRLIQASSNPSLLKEAVDWEGLEGLYENEEYGRFPDFSMADRGFDLNSEKIISLAEKVGIATKTQATINLIARLTASGEKVLVWCLFTKTIEFLKRYLGQKGIVAESIYGVDDLKTRDAKIAAFKTGGCQVLITNPNTLAESVSLHMVCHNAIYLEYGFNLIYMLQSKDRINRVGLSAGTHTHYFYAVAKSGNYGSIDSLVLDRLKMKSDRMLGTIESGKIAVIGSEGSELDDIKYILGKGRKIA